MTLLAVFKKQRKKAVQASAPRRAASPPARVNGQAPIRAKPVVKGAANPPPLPAAIAQIAVRDGGVIYVLSGQQAHPVLQSWLYEARRVGFAARIELCDMPTLSGMRSGSVADGAQQTAALSNVKHVRRIWAEAVERRASDIHFTLYADGGNGYMDIQYRIKGDVVNGRQMPETLGAEIIGSLYQGVAAVADAQQDDNVDQNAVITNPLFLRGEDGRDLGLVGVRLAKSKLMHGIGVAARLLYRPDESGNGHGEALDRLGYSPRQTRVLKRLTRQTMGINPFTGPTGSGKSTTLAAQIRDIRTHRPGLRIITIEDPVEYEFRDPHIWQFYIANANTDEEKSTIFATKVKASLREDPDVIVVGEIRGIETAREAMTAAITGHQIWTTLHVSDAFMIPTRLILMGLDSFYLRDPKLLSSLIAQRLVKTLCPHCALPLAGHEDRIDPEIVANLRTWLSGSPFTDLSRVRVRGSGCPLCDHHGVVGRTVIAQVIPTDEDLLADVIQNGPAQARRRYMVRPDAEIDMMAHGVLKVLAGEIDPAAVEELLEPIPKRPDDLRALTMEDL